MTSRIGQRVEAEILVLICEWTVAVVVVDDVVGVERIGACTVDIIAVVVVVGVVRGGGVDVGVVVQLVRVGLGNGRIGWHIHAFLIRLSQILSRREVERLLNGCVSIGWIERGHWQRHAALLRNSLCKRWWCHVHGRVIARRVKRT